MPFDVVYLDRFEESKILSVKNLIGRAGRSTNKPVFDFGSVILRPNAMSRFRKVYRKKNTLSSKSRLDTTDDKIDEKYEEYKEAIKTGEFSDEYNPVSYTHLSAKNNWGVFNKTVHSGGRRQRVY